MPFAAGIGSHCPRIRSGCHRVQLTLVALGSGPYLLPLIWILLLVIMGIVCAANGQGKPVVILGKNNEQRFANAFS